MNTTYRVFIKKKVVKQIELMPPKEQQALIRLIEDLKFKGPIQREWSNFSKIGPHEYHCHLSYRWVACWYYKEDGKMEIEVYYAGSREKAPY